MVATMEEEAAGVSDDDIDNNKEGHDGQDDENDNAAVAADVEDNEHLHRQPIYTIINH